MNVPFVPTSGMLSLPQPYLLFLGDTKEPSYAKTAFGLRDWAGEACVGGMVCGGGSVKAGLPRLTPAEARARGGRSIVIGVANEGGGMGEGWMSSQGGGLAGGHG